MDRRNLLGAIKLPVAVVVALNIALIGIYFFSFEADFLGTLLLLMAASVVIGLPVSIWAGYKAAGLEKGLILSGAGGAITAIVSVVAFSLLIYLLVIPILNQPGNQLAMGPGQQAEQSSMSAVGAFMGQPTQQVAEGFIPVLLSLTLIQGIAALLLGFAAGSIGGFIGSKTHANK